MINSSSTTATPVKTMTPVRSNPHQSNAHSASASSLPANDLDVIQDMIDCSANRLEGLRTQCLTSTLLTQREIRSLETKLLRMFSELLLTKGRLNERLPASGLPHTSGNELRQWLRVVGLSQETLNVCLTRLSTLEQLLELNEDALKELLEHNPNYREEELRRLTKAMQNLRKCKDILTTPAVHETTQDSELATDAEETKSSRESNEQLIEQLFWDSWDRHHRGSVGNIGITASPRTNRNALKQAKQQQQHQSNRQSPSNDNQSAYKSSSSTTSINNSMNDDNNSTQSSQSSALTLTLTPSPPNSPFSISTSVFGGGGGGSLNGTPQKTTKIAGTPPPMKKHMTSLNSNQPLTPTHAASLQHSAGGYHHQQAHQQDHIPIPLSKSKSNESQFQDSSLSSMSTTIISSPTMANSGGGGGGPLKYNSGYGSNTTTATRSRLNTDPSPDSHSSASSDIFVESSNNSSNNNSLQVPLSPCTPIVNLSMSHNIAHRFNTVVKVATCDLCLKPMFIGRKCKECKYRCHKVCEPDVPPSCCLPPEFIKEFKNAIKDQVAAGYHNQLTHTLQTQSPNQSHGSLGKQRKARTAGGGRHQKHGSNVSASNAGGIIGGGGMHADSSSPGSSCNSSSPSSPALFNLQHHHSSGDMQATTIMSSSAGGSSTSSNMLSTPSSHKNASQFNFPDVTITSNCNNPAGATTETILSAQNANTCSPSHEYNMMDGDGQQQQHQQQRSRNNSNEALISSTGNNSNNLSGSGSGAAVGGVQGNSSSSTTMSSSSTTTTSHHNNIAAANNIVNAGPATFFPRKLSSAGVDKRGNFTELSDTHKSNDSDKTVSLSGSTSASTDSDRTPVRLDSTEDGDSGNWPRQNSLSLKEWDIPYGDLKMLEKIGQGRFGTVHRAMWHGSVAVKLLKEDYLADEQMLEVFKAEVANFKKTRHENLVLFMGACMNPPYLAIVTSLCKGNTLYTHIHSRREKFVINKTTLIAQQITQGMGYLHARGIIHKDLRTKNIFLENGKVIITDFGLFSSTKLLYCDKGLGVPLGWLCYLAPELMRCLMPCKPTGEILPFSAASDVYSFGTVWYELLCGEFPFKSQPPESIIWQVGRGMKQTLANLQTSRDVKDILMLCWHYTVDDRPDFPKLLTLFERLPKKRLARSPSHPIQLSRSAEAIF
ncbi:kinase suppressor of Ras 2 [Musca domestica]|uniref:Kinase suppressor of Ras 2 n=1 Tax=Musca domestica TaxID=7370 RepID=A0A9J7D459_MUSDO|nr:kinase suppressor of Ras 2 [Musca domestica]